jgi:hypothetical protein
MGLIRSAASFVFFFVAGTAAFGLGACGSTSGGSSSSSDAATDVVGNADSPAPCPAERPSPTSPCTNGGQVGCFYPNQGGCGGATCTCHGSGSWSCFNGGGSCDAGPSDGSGDSAFTDGDTCPASPPPIGGSCSGGLSCSYCDGGALCDCNLGQWECGGAIGCIEAHD